MFLAGPIQGAQDWQAVATALLTQSGRDLSIANPRLGVFGPDFVASDQVDWESAMLARASAQGVILFWLAAESTHTCTRAYAQTTRLELGEWLARSRVEGTKLSIGIDATFSGAEYIQHRIATDNTNLSVYSSLEDTCKGALALL